MQTLFMFTPMLLALFVFASFVKLAARLLNYLNLRWKSGFIFAGTLLAASVMVRLVETMIGTALPPIAGTVILLAAFAAWGAYFFSTRAITGTQTIGWLGGLKLTGVSLGLLFATGMCLTVAVHFLAPQSTNFK
jgi:hypothetical protein